MKLKIVDLFAGAGGLSLGFEMTEMFEMVLAVENNRFAQETYKKNNQNVEICGDIRNVDYEACIKKNGHIDVVIGGPPCQGFSNANRQKSKLISGNNSLVKEYIKAIKSLKPDVFVMENVKTIASKSHKFFMTANEDISELGVQIHNEKMMIYKNDKQLAELFMLLNDSAFRNQHLLDNETLKSLKLINRKFLREEKAKEYFKKKSANINKFLEKIKPPEGILLPVFYSEVIGQAIKGIAEYSSTGQGYESCKANITKLNDVQNAIESIRELENNHVLYKLKMDESEIYIESKTYIVMDYLKATFSKLGYEFVAGTINAAMFGVPQKRNRYVIIGARKDAEIKEPLFLPKPIINNEQNYYTVTDALMDLANLNTSFSTDESTIEIKNMLAPKNMFDLIVKNSNTISNHIVTNSTEEAKKRFASLNQGENFHDLKVDLKKSYSDPTRTQNTIYKRLISNEPSDTVLNARKSMWIHPTIDRAVSVREVARLQSFPDSYIFSGTKDSQYQQIGNAVPPLLARAIAETVLNILGKKATVTIEELMRRFESW